MIKTLMLSQTKSLLKSHLKVGDIPILNSDKKVKIRDNYRGERKPCGFSGVSMHLRPSKKRRHYVTTGLGALHCICMRTVRYNDYPFYR
jgi:hypothetical protein